jgi:hypothetical membrane protein
VPPPTSPEPQGSRKLGLASEAVDAPDLDDGGVGSRALAASGLAGAIVFTAAWIVAGLTEPGFSFVHNDTSDLGSLTAAHPTPYNVAVSLSGVLTIGLAVALVRVVGRRRVVVGGAILVAVFGVGQFVDGLAREDCPVSVDAVCRAAEKAGNVSMHHKVHNAESLITFSALMLAPLVLGLVLRSIPRWRVHARWSLAAAAVQVVCLPVFLLMFSNGTNGQGAVEIIEVTAGVTWIAAMSISILRLRAGTPSAGA